MHLEMMLWKSSKVIAAGTIILRQTDGLVMRWSLILNWKVMGFSFLVRVCQTLIEIIGKSMNSNERRKEFYEDFPK